MIPLTYLYSEFVTQSFESHEAFVDHIISRQQEIHDLIRRNAHQAQRRQKLKYDQNIRAKASSVGEPEWVFCCYTPQKGTPKLIRAFRGPHKIARVLQEGRVYFLDTEQKEHFERLKPHNSGPTEWSTIPTNKGNVAVIMDTEPEQSLEEFPDDASQPSYREEEPKSEASNNPYLPGKDTGGTPDCVHEYVQEEVVGIINNSVLQLTLMRNHRMFSCQVRKQKLTRNKNWPLSLRPSPSHQLRCL